MSLYTARRVVEEGEIAEENATTGEETPSGEKVSLHIYLTREGCERIKDLAEYTALEGMIGGRRRGNFSSYTNSCFQLRESYIKQLMLKKRGYK